MRRVFDAYLAMFFFASVAILVGFTAASAVPPRWLLAAFLPFLLVTLGGVVWLTRQETLADEVLPDRTLELTD